MKSWTLFLGLLAPYRFAMVKNSMSYPLRDNLKSMIFLSALYVPSTVLIRKHTEFTQLLPMDTFMVTFKPIHLKPTLAGYVAKRYDRLPCLLETLYGHDLNLLDWRLVTIQVQSFSWR
jgi:hypothetical protein